MASHELSIRSGLQLQPDYIFDDFYVNNRRLSDILGARGSVTPFGWLGTEIVSRAALEDQFARMLLGVSPSDLRPGRVPIFICELCADYGCGVTTCQIDIMDDLVVWSDFGWDNNYEEETLERDSYLGHSFSFERVSYEALLSRYTIKANKAEMATPRKPSD